MSLLFIGESAIDALLISLCAAIFEFAAKCFEVFIYLTEIPMVDSSQYNTLVRNVYILVGVVVLFALAFGLLKAMVNPDNSGKSTEETGGIIKNLITSIVILIIVPSIFNFAFGLQSSLINYNTIGKIFGSSSTYSNKTSSTEFIKSQGNTLTNQVFKTFFSPNVDYCKSLDLDISTESGYNKCLKEVKVSKAFSWLPFADEEPSLATVYSSVDNNGSFFSYVTFSDSVADGETNFNFLIMLAAGIFLCYVIVSFCFDMGIRLVKLVFYQLIAPIPIMMRVIPDKKMSESFGTWVKICITCYMEVFIRLLAIYFTCYLCNVIIDNTLGAAGTNAGWGVTLFGKAFIIMGLIAFMKESPKLISEVIGVDSSNMSLGIKDKLAKGGFFAAGAALGTAGTMMARGAVGAAKNIKDMGRGNRSAKKVAGAIGGGLKSAVAGGLAGFGRGLWAGRNAKSYADMKNTTNSATDAIENKRKKAEVYKSTHGGTALGVAKGKVMDTIGTVSAWSGWSAVDEGEANRYSAAANAFDAAHTQAEGVYKNKPGHNKLKEITAEKDSVVKRIKANLAELNNAQYKESTLQAKISDLTNRENSLQTQLNNNRTNMSQEQIDELDSQIRSIQSEITSKQSDLSDVQNLINNRQTLETQYNAELSVAQKELDVAKLEQSQHEAGEMKKKISVVMEATNDLVNAKTKYADLENEIFKDSTFDAFLDSATSQAERTATENLINKIKNNELIDVPDISGVNINGLEQFLDRISINAKNIASKKRAAVGHANALEDAKKSDDK